MLMTATILIQLNLNQIGRMNKTDLLDYLGLSEGGKESREKESNKSMMKLPPDLVKIKCED